MGSRFIILALAIALSFAAGGLAVAYFLTPQPLNLESESNWVLVRSFKGIIDPSQGPALARVYVIWHPSTGIDPHEVFQNRIDVKGSIATSSFSWPTIKEYAAGWCEIEDLDGDQYKEFLLFQGTHVVRVVSYSFGQFVFREHKDELHSSASDLEVLDLDHDGRYEFVKEDMQDGKTELSIKQWAKDGGFHDAPESLLLEYKRRIAR